MVALCPLLEELANFKQKLLLILAGLHSHIGSHLKDNFTFENAQHYIFSVFSEKNMYRGKNHTHIKHYVF